MSQPTRGSKPARKPNRSTPPTGRRPGTRPPAQSREEARRAQIARRKKAMRRRRFLFSFALLLVVAAVGIILSLTVFFKIETIDVKGKSRYASAEIVNASGVKKEQNLFLISAEEASSAIRSRLPYIHDVKIRRVLPGTLSIEVTEGKAAYGLKQQNKKYTLLDDQFKVLQNDAGKLPGSAALVTGVTLKEGVPGKAAVFKQDGAAQALEGTRSAANAAGLTEITEISIKSSTDVWATYQGRIRLQLGSATDLEYKFSFAKKSIDRLNETTPGAKGSLNLTVKKNAYWQEDTAAR